jgi:2-hydroxycyclohexanecarboxyl-CoA dehydrogenase
MRPRGGGSVVFLTSEGGRVPTPGQTAVSTFAGGLIRASKVIARELARDRIRVNDTPKPVAQALAKLIPVYKEYL